MSGHRGVRRLKARLAVGRNERARLRREKAGERSRVLLGVYGLGHLDTHAGADQVTRIDSGRQEAPGVRPHGGRTWGARLHG